MNNNNNNNTIQQEDVSIDLILFTLYSIILTILFGIWCRTIFFSNTPLSSAKMIRNKLNLKKRITKSRSNMRTTLNDIQKLTITISPNQCVTSPKLPSPPSPITHKKHAFNTPISPQSHNMSQITPFQTDEVNIFIPRPKTLLKAQTSNSNVTVTETHNDELNDLDDIIDIDNDNNIDIIDKQTKTKKQKQKKQIKLEPSLKIFGTASIFFAVLYSYLSCIELLLIYNNTYLKQISLSNICYICSITITPMLFNRLSIYLYLIFRIYFVFHSSIYGVSSLFISALTAVIILIFISTYAFFNIYITLIATQCNISNVNIALMPSRFSDFVITVSLTLAFIYKLNKLVKRCNNNKTTKVKYLINKLLILLIVSSSCSLSSYILFIVYSNNNNTNYSLQALLRFDVFINTICLMFSLSSFDKLYQYLCFPLRIIYELKK